MKEKTYNDPEVCHRQSHTLNNPLLFGGHDDKNLRHRVAYVIIRREPRSSAQNVARCCCLCYGPLDENLLNARISFPIPRLVPLNV